MPTLQWNIWIHAIVSTVMKKANIIYYKLVEKCVPLHSL